MAERFDAFISYSHAADGLLAPRLAAGLQRFAKPWYRPRAMRVFRDEASLSANPHLWASITDALDKSEWFVLLLSPDAAQSEWVNKEIDYWLDNKNSQRILPVVTEGEIDWTDQHQALPPALAGVFTEEPRWVDLRFARSDDQLDLKNPRFSAAVADIASAVRGVAKDQLESEEVRQHRRTVRTAWTGAALVTLLAVAAAGFAINASQERDRANQLTQAEAQARADAEDNAAQATQQRQAAENARAEAESARDEARRTESLATARELAANAVINLDTDPELSLILSSLAAQSVDVVPNEVFSALQESVLTSRIVERQERVDDLPSYLTDGSPGELRGNQVAREADLFITTVGTEVVVARISDRSELWREDLGPISDAWVRISPDGSYATTVTFPEDFINGDELTVRLRDGLTGETLVDFTQMAEGVPIVVPDLMGFHPEIGLLALADGWNGVSLVNLDHLTQGAWHLIPFLMDTDVSPDGTLWGLTMSGELYDLRTGEMAHVLRHEAGALALAVTGDSIFTGDDAGLVRRFDRETGELVAIVGFHQSPVDGLEAVGDTLVRSWAGPAIALWDSTRSGRGGVMSYDPGESEGTSIAVSGNGGFVLTTAYIPGVSPQSRTSVFERDDGSERGREMSTIGFGAALSADGTVFATQREAMLEDGSPWPGPIVLFEFESGDEIELAGSERHAFQAMGFSEDGSLFVAGDNGGRPSVWNALDGTQISDLEGGSWQVTAAAFVPAHMLTGADAGRQVVAALHGEGILRFSDALTGDELGTIDLGEPFPVDLAFHPSRPVVAISDNNSDVVSVWDIGDLTDPKLVRELDGHRGGAFGADFDQDGSRLATASADGSVRIWDTSSWTESRRIDLPTGAEDVLFVPGAERVVVSLADASVTEIPLGLDELIDLATSRTTRSLTAEECATYLHGPCPDG